MNIELSAVLSAALQVADTVVMVAARDGLETAAAVSVVVVGVFFLLLVPLLLLLLLQLRKVNRTVRELGEKGLRRADPILERGKSVADNVEFVSMAVRTDVERITSSVKSLSDRLQQASDRMEERVAEFNALMEVVQSEAEDIFVGTAATVRGVRAGARSLGSGARENGGEPDEAELRRRRPGEVEPEGEVYVSRPEPGD
jgi:hypothetical protein